MSHSVNGPIKSSSYTAGTFLNNIAETQTSSKQNGDFSQLTLSFLSRSVLFGNSVRYFDLFLFSF